MSASNFPATRFIVTANIVVFVAMCIVSGGKAVQAPSSEMLLDWGANFAPLSLNGEWWRMFSSMFLHIGFVHIAFNMAALWNLGQSAEELFGTRRFLNLYFISGFGGSCLSLLFNPGVVSAGASGAIFGVYGSLFAFFFAHRKEMGKEAFLAGSKSATAFLVINIVLGFTFGFDNFCHLGGLVSGFICGSLYLPRANKPSAKHPVFGTFLLIAAIYGLFNYAKTVPFDFADRYYVSVARDMLQHGKYAEATEVLNKALRKKPDHAEALYLRGLANIYINRPQEALADLEQAAVLDPRETRAAEWRDRVKAALLKDKTKKEQAK